MDMAESALKSDSRALTVKNTVADFVPLLAILPDGAILLKDGSLARIFHVQGHDGETVTQADKTAQSEQARATLQQFDERVTLWTTVRRRRTTPDFEEHFSNRAAQRAHDAYIAQFDGQQAFRTDIHITLILQTDLRKTSFFDRVSRHHEAGRGMGSSIIKSVWETLNGHKQYVHSDRYFAPAKRKFEALCGEFVANMQGFGLRALEEERTLELYHDLVNPISGDHAMRAPSAVAPMDALIADVQVHREGGGFAPEALRIFDGEGNKYIKSVSFYEWAEWVSAGAMDDLMAVHGEITLTIVAQFLSSEKAQQMLSSIDSKLSMSFTKFSELISRSVSKGGGDEGGEGIGRNLLREEVQEAHARTFAENLKWGHVFSNILCYGDNVEEATVTATEVAAILRRRGFVARTESLHLLQSWAAALPGQWSQIKSWWPLTVEYFSDLLPLRQSFGGETENPYLTKILRRRARALSQFKTAQGGTYALDLHAYSKGDRENDNGHFLIVAPTGGGKSVLANWLIMQFRRYDPTRIIVLDKDLSCKIPILAQGGTYLETAGGRLDLNPFSLLAEGEKHINFLVQWIRRLLEGEGVRSVSDTEITSALRHLARTGGGDGTGNKYRLKNFLNFLPNNDAKAALEPWLEGNAYGGMDRVHDGFRQQMEAESYCLAVDLKRIFSDAKFGEPCLDYILYCIEQAIDYEGDGAAAIRPGMLYIEECWKIFQLPRLARQLEDWLRTLRKKNIVVGMATQSLQDLQKSGLFEVLVDSTPNQFFLGNREAATQAELYKKFRLTDEDVERIAKMGVGNFLYIKSGHLKKMLKFQVPPEVLKMLVVNESSLGEMERVGIRRYIGEDGTGELQ